MLSRVVFLLGFLSLLASWCEPAAAQTKVDPAGVAYFERHIRPALVTYCYSCHSVEEGDSRAGLLVDTREGLLEGGDSGPSIVPGNLRDSLIWDAINWDGYEMPPSEKMPADVIAHFKKWIEMGAPDPRERKYLEFKTKITADDIEDRRAHWAFQVPEKPDGDIDSLVAKKLAEEGLTPAKEADPSTLLRRINFDLIGLPPTPSEIKSFGIAYQRNADRAVQFKVDELLDRPQYGERWGRHWLDVARYAESSGSRNTPYPHAWRYRNYVIDAFNKDTPYDRFIKEQIAGDLLPAKTDEEWNNNLLATGFLAIGMKHHDQKNPRQFMSDMVDEQLDTTTQAVLGLTVACARCHDHKYDPVPSDDYYRLAGIFYSTKTYYGTSRIGQNHRPSDLLLLPIQEGKQANLGSGRGRSQTREQLEAQIAELDREMRGVTGQERRNLRNNRNRIATQLAAINPDGTLKTFAMGVQENDEMINANILVAGEVDRPAQEVPRGFVQILGDLNFTVDSDQSSGRIELVEALTSKENPLTARVMINRVWMHLIGKPLVETTTNFGYAGTEPSNPELLDYLAVRFMEEDWSIKQMIREIVMSKTYRRSTQYIAANYEVDPDNKLNWRANAKVLDAEALRDAMLALSGRLNFERPEPSTGGRPGPGPGNAAANDTHRSVYLSIDRENVPESLDLFDFADPNMTSPGRSESIVPTQALYLMNGDFVTTSAASMAASLERNYRSQDEQIQTAFLWAYGRQATSEELQASAQFFREFRSTSSGASSANSTSGAGPRGRGGPNGRGRGGPGGPGGRRGGPRAAGGGAVAANQTPLAVFCQTLMASARFRILN